MKEFIITEEKIKNLLWWVENLGLKPAEDCLNEVLTSTPIIDRNTCGCLCDCCVATECVRNSGRGYPLVKECLITYESSK
jgi:hypothetical protein